MRTGYGAIALGAVAHAAVALAVASGCRREAAAPPLPPAEVTQADEAAPPPEEAAADFVPPATLADLDRQVTWMQRPVRDALSQAQAATAAAPGSVAEALALVNDSPEANAAIRAALFGPPPAGDRPSVDRVTRHLLADVGSLDPLRAETAADFDVLALTGVDLFGFDRTLEPFANADTVTSWQTSADGLVDKVVLRDDLAWSDGRPITARDVAFSWRLIVGPDSAARAFRDGAARVRAVRAYDDRTVVMFRAEPLATAAWDIDFPIVPRHVDPRTRDSEPGPAADTEPEPRPVRLVTGGPYEVAARTPGRELVLRRRAGWSTVRGRKVREPARCAEIRFRVVDDPAATLEALESGALDEAALDPDRWIAATGAAFTERATKVMAPAWRGLQIAWNLDSPLFADRRVRRAIGYAFDHARLRDELCHGLATAATGPFAPDSWIAGRSRTEAARLELDKAEALLDEAGWIDHDSDGVRDAEVEGRLVPFQFTVLCDRRPLQVATCTLLQECLRRVGVNCTVRSLDPQAARDLYRAGHFEACLVTWGSGFDPDSAASLWSSTGAMNACGYANADVDRLFAEGRRERDRGRRAEVYGRIHDILAEDQPCTWLVWQQDLRGVSRRIAADLFDLRGATHWSPGLSGIWKPELE
jgi:peptide/nickel transport system substrate-binding protein